jgi:hypothetical protein
MDSHFIPRLKSVFHVRTSEVVTVSNLLYIVVSVVKC